MRENIVDTLTLGTFIFSAKFVNKIPNDYPLNDTNYSLWQNIVPYYYVANNIDDVLSYFSFNNAIRSDNRLKVLLEVKETDKLGMEQIQEDICKNK